MDALTYFLTGLTSGLQGGVKGYGDAEERRRKTAKENLADAITMGAPAAKVGALYQEAMRPGTIEGWLGAKPEGISPTDYANAYDAKNNLAEFDKTFTVIAPHVPADTMKKLWAVREYLRSRGMQPEEPVATPATVAAPPPIAPVAPTPLVAEAPPIAPATAVPAPVAPPLAEPVGGMPPSHAEQTRRVAAWFDQTPDAPIGPPEVPGPYVQSIPKMPYTPLTSAQQDVIAMGIDNVPDAGAPPQDLEEVLPEAKIVTSLPGDNPGMVAPGNIDLDNRGIVKDKDGLIDIERPTLFTYPLDLNKDGQISGEERNVEILLPTVINGKKVSEEDARTAFLRGGEHFGAFATKEAAAPYIQRMHERWATRYGQPAETPAAPATSPPAAPAAPPVTPAPAVPEDPRKIAARKYLNPDGTLNLDAVEMAKKPLDYLTTVDGVSIFQDPATGAMSTKKLVPEKEKAPKPAQMGWVIKGGKKVWSELKPGTISESEPAKPEDHYGWRTVSGKKVYGKLEPGMTSEEPPDNGADMLIKLQRIDGILAGHHPGGAMLKTPEYLAERQKLLLASGLPDDTGLPPPAASKPGKPKPPPKKSDGKAASKDHSALWK